MSVRSRRACGTLRASQIHDDIQITLTVARLNVFYAMIFFGQRPQAFVEKFKALDTHGELVGFGSEDLSRDADEIANSNIGDKGFEHLGCFFSLAHADLHFPGVIKNVGKQNFSHRTQANNPTSNGYVTCSFGSGNGLLDCVRLGITVGQIPPFTLLKEFTLFDLKHGF